MLINVICFWIFCRLSACISSTHESWVAKDVRYGVLHAVVGFVEKKILDNLIRNGLEKIKPNSMRICLLRV